MVSKVWDVMNDLEMVTSKICSAREIIDAAIDRIQEHQYDKAETMMSAAYEFLGYYLDEFDEKFKLAWQETVVKQKEREEITFGLSNPSIGYGNTAFFNVNTAGNMTPSHISPVTFNKDDQLSEYKGSLNNFWYSEKASDDCMPPWGHSDLEYSIHHTNCDKDDTTEECQKSWNSFWDEQETIQDKKFVAQYTEEELNSMCDKAASDEEKEKCLEYNVRESEYYNVDPKGNKVSVKKWILPVEECKDTDTDETEYFVSFPDDLLEAADLKEGDQVEWIDNGDGSFKLIKFDKPSWIEGNELAKVKTYDEMISDGWTITDDGFWVKK